MEAIGGDGGGGGGGGRTVKFLHKGSNFLLILIHQSISREMAVISKSHIIITEYIKNVPYLVLGGLGIPNPNPWYFHRPGWENILLSCTKLVDMFQIRKGNTLLRIYSGHFLNIYKIDRFNF